jgi:hypothetical protein
MYTTMYNTLCITQVFAPASGEQVTVSLDTDVFDVLLHDALYTKLRWHSLKGYELAQIDCAVAQPSSTAIVSSSKSGEKRPPPTLTAQQVLPLITTTLYTVSILCCSVMASAC